MRVSLARRDSLCGMKPVKVLVLVDMTENCFTGPDVGGVIGLELETVPKTGLERIAVHDHCTDLSRMYSYFSGPRTLSRCSGSNICGV